MVMDARPRAGWFVAALAMYMPMCTPEVRPTAPTPQAPVASLWRSPDDLANRDLFHGVWGADRAPRPEDRYMLIRVKRSGVNPGLTVRDGRGRKWSVKQPLPDALGDEGPVEVTLSRVLSAVGYHQPPVYFLPSFSLTDDWGTRREPGGRFRLADPSLEELGPWSWQQNPFVGSQPYQGLLAILLLLKSSDLKNDNNSIYRYRQGDRIERWYVVRDLGTALGETGRLAPRKNEVELFERSRFIIGVTRGFVQFDYRGWHQELVRNRLTPEDVRWGATLLFRLTDLQWRDAFRAGGYSPAVADRFIGKIQANIAEAMRVGEEPSSGSGRQ